MINVTTPYLPSRKTVDRYLDQIYDSKWLSNGGVLCQALESRLAEYLRVKHIVLVANGTLALQIAFRALELRGDVITTPFSFIATASSLKWEGLEPIFSDVDPKTFNLSPELIAERITENTSAILPVHVFGNPCDVKAIQHVATTHNLKVVYDAAHAFGAQNSDGDLFSYGDVSTLSFHATKLFHTCEGGCIATNSEEVALRARRLINFGIEGPNVYGQVGINAKMSEVHAAFGLATLDDIDSILENRQHLLDRYKTNLEGVVGFQTGAPGAELNGAYAPVVFESEQQLLSVVGTLDASGIGTRRYFYPSLDSLAFLSQDAEEMCSSRDLASRILCLPISADLKSSTVDSICKTIKKALVA